MTTGGYWSVLPADVRRDRRLPDRAKLLYAELTGLVQRDGYCWATDEYLAELLDCSAKTVSRSLKQLRELGYIQVERTSNATGTERHIYCGLNPAQGGTDKNDRTDGGTDGGTDKNDRTPPATQYKENNKNNTTGARENGTAREEEISQILLDFAGGDDGLRSALSDFRQDRRLRRKPIKTPLAAKRLVSRLDKLSGGDRRVMIAMLDKAIERGWDSVYELRPDDLPAAAGPPGNEPERRVWTPGVIP